MTAHQSIMNDYANDAVADFLRDHPEASVTDVINGLQDAISDAPTIYDAERAEPAPLDPETIAARQSAYERDLIDAGRGHLIGGAA